MIFLFRLSDLFLVFCIFAVICIGFSPSHEPDFPLGMKIQLLVLPTAYVLWRVRRPVKWIIGALIFIAVFFYTFMAGLLGKHPEPDVEEE
jgi:hypothetical protein